MEHACVNTVICFTCFVSDPQTAQTMILLVILVMSCPTYLLQYAPKTPTSLKTLACVLSPTAMSYGANIIAELEVCGV